MSIARKNRDGALKLGRSKLLEDFRGLAAVRTVAFDVDHPSQIVSGLPTQAPAGQKNTLTTLPSWAAFCSSDTYRMRGRTFSISARLAASGELFTAGFRIGWKDHANFCSNE
jgi:hypothetical protein